jgi:lipopolysaccharide transport system ATP-binding protein
MSSSRITFDHVWMKFHRGETHDSLRDLLPAMAKRLVGRGPNPAELGDEDFWAVRDLSFVVNPGQVLGVIGANGSGKSTTLRILTKILEPTRGRCEIRGRVGALIEVSAGFHGDLTGRENVFLQGAIMGLRAREIARKFDEIVEFAGIAEFIDTPVKRYSSGMNARLGFSVAAHMDPDVLIIDEVLAVGDYQFQERAFGRISQLARSGIPVVVVSHQLDRIAELCTDAILLEHGVPTCHGAPSECIAAYLRPSATDAADDDRTASPDAPVVFRALHLEGSGEVRSGEWCTLRVDGEIRGSISDTIDPFRLRVRSLTNGQVIYVTGREPLGLELPEGGRFTAEVALQANVAPGNYLVEAAVFDTVGNRNLARASSAVIRVTDPGTFRGTVQLNPRVRFIERT